MPAAWLNYAALDVEVLIGLRESIAAVLAEQGKTAWAAEEFDYLRSGAGQAPPATRRDRWRRTSGLHRVRNQRALAAVRELWIVRDEIAQRRDIAPGRILPDSAIIDAATADPKTLDDLVALPIFGGKRQRRSAPTWLAALKAARENPGAGDEIEPPNGPPAPARWARRRPEAAARLEAARAALRELSEEVTVPSENLVTPDLVRRLCWDWEAADDTATRGRRVSGGWSGPKLAARASSARAGRGVATAAQRQRRRQSSCSVIAASRPASSRDNAAIQPVMRRATS